MRVDIHFPTLVRSTQPGSRKTGRYFFGSDVIGADIPEISVRETEVALGNVTVDSHRHGMTRFPVLRSYDGKTYRPVAATASLFSQAFSDWYRQEDPDFAICDPMPPRHGPHPVAGPVQTRHQWFLNLHGMDTARNYRLWPEYGDPVRQDGRPAYKPPADRNAVFFDKSGATDIDADDLADCRAMHQAQTDRLLVIGGRFWMEATPPCVNVTIPGDRGYKPGVKVWAGFMPQDFDKDGCTTRFPLDMLPEAMEFAGTLARRFGKPEFDDLARVGLPDGGLTHLSFDQDHEEVRSFGVVLASNLVRRVEQQSFHKMYEGALPLFEGNRLETVGHIKSELLAGNGIVGEKADLTDILPEVLELWNVKKPRFEGLGLPPGYAAPLFFERALEKADNAPIGLMPSLAQPRRP